MIDRIKAFFSRKQMLQEQSLPNYALTYFDHLYGQYQSFHKNTVDEEDKFLITAFLEKRKNSSVTWNDLYTFELVLIRYQSVETLRRKVWGLRSRYRDVAGEREFSAYFASNPPDPGLPATTEEALRTDIEYLLSEIHLRYALRPAREKTRSWLSRWVAIITIGGLLVVLSFLFLANNYDSVNPMRKAGPLTVVMFVGAMGGLVSLQQRFQSLPDEGDPIDNVSELEHGRFFILPAISGGIFAALLYLLFAGGLLAGELFPVIPVVEPSDEGERILLTNLLIGTGPEDTVEYAKLLIWSFLAGFAERLVPDTLTRLVERRDVRSKQAAK